jgi:formylglycine-generating enzyme required for sulfatase activity
MNDKARQILKQLLDQHGRDLVNQQGRVKGFLEDLCAGNKRDTRLLLAVVQNGMAKELLQDGGTNLPILIPRMAGQLHDDYGFEPQLAKWAVESWALALGYRVPQVVTPPVIPPGGGEEGGRQEQAGKHQEQSSTQPKHGEAWTEPYTGMEFVWVPGGVFEMGDVFGDGLEREKPMHTVELDGFWLGRYPVTQAQWMKVMGNNPSYFREPNITFSINNPQFLPPSPGRQSQPNNPVECVSWHDAQEFISKLNSRSKDSLFCLPTEAQWEYAARSGGKRELYAGGNDIDRVAWYFDNSGGKTHPVGQKAPNGLGIYDMTGNVWEWCHDWFDENYYARSPRSNPSGPSGGSSRVLRGGSWLFNARNCRTAIRLNLTPGYRNSGIGLRLAFPPGQQ